MKKIMAFSGPSNSGKTTLILKLNEIFINQGLKTLIIKHDPGDKARFDVRGKDSFKFFESGADVIVLSPTRTSFFSHFASDIKQTLKIAKNFDICLIEGLKSLDLPRISVFKDEVDESYFGVSKAIASYEKPKNLQNLTWLDLNEIEKIAKYTLENAKIIE